MFGMVAGVIVFLLCYLQAVYSAGLWVFSLPWLISRHRATTMPRVNRLVYSNFPLIVMIVAALTFFFSSRRRHTRLTCDWSSDVCSSDLEDKNQLMAAAVEGSHPGVIFGPHTEVLECAVDLLAGGQQLEHVAPIHANEMQRAVDAVAGKQRKKIGRASCRERGESEGGGGG